MKDMLFMSCCFDRYKNNIFVHAALAIIGIFSIFSFFWGWLYPQLGNTYSPDSFAYYILGRNIFSGDGFSTSAIRDFYLTPTFPSPSRSFPVLFPFFVGLFDQVLKKGIYSSTYLNLAVLFLTTIIFYFFSKTLSYRYRFLIFCGFPIFFFLDSGYRDEIAAGRAIPLSILWLLLFFIFLLRGLKNNNKYLLNDFLVGLFLACLVLTRTDQTIFALLAPILISIIYKINGLSRKESIVRGLVIIVSFFIFYSPFGIWNLTNFGSYFASDNSLTVLSTVPAIVQLTYWESGRPPLLFDNPGLWFNQRIGYFFENLKQVKIITNYLILYLIINIIFIRQKITKKQFAFLMMVALYAIANVMAISLTPYHDNRYFSTLHLLLIVGFVLTLCTLLSSENNNKSFHFVKLFSFLFILVIALNGNIAKNIKNGFLSHDKRLIPYNIDVRKQEYDLVVSTFKDHINKQDDPVIAIYDAEAFHYFTGYKSIFIPLNSNRFDEHFRAWLHRWRPNFIISSKEWTDSMGIANAVLTSTSTAFQLIDVDKIIDGNFPIATE